MEYIIALLADDIGMSPYGLAIALVTVIAAVGFTLVVAVVPMLDERDEQRGQP
jgi:hypothetical protein